MSTITLVLTVNILFMMHLCKWELLPVTISKDSDYVANECVMRVWGRAGHSLPTLDTLPQ